MKKIYLIAIIPLALGLGCFIAYNVIGSSVAPDGTLIEAFGLIPIGILFVGIGVMSGLILITKAWIDKRKHSKLS